MSNVLAVTFTCNCGLRKLLLVSPGEKKNLENFLKVSKLTCWRVHTWSEQRSFGCSLHLAYRGIKYLALMRYRILVRVVISQWNIASILREE